MTPRLVPLLLLASLACRDAAFDASQAARPSSDSLGYFFGGYQPQQTIGLTSETAPAPPTPSPIVVPSSDLPPVTPPDISNMVIRTASASIKVDSLEPAVAAVRELATRLGGYLANTEVMTGSNQLRTARMEVKIPASRFDESLAGLSPIGEVETVSVAAEDVGEQFVDVSARMDNARRLERRLIDLLANRTGKLKDVLDVEQELARVREQIERYEGRIRFLRAHTAMSTISIYVHEPPPLVGGAGHSVLGEAFRQAWRNFVAFVSVGVQSLGILVPLGLIAVVVWIGTRRWRRLISQRTA